MFNSMSEMRFKNQNSIRHKADPFSKTASVYDKMGESNRVVEEKPLHFSSLSASDTNFLREHLAKEASDLNSIPLEKRANAMNLFDLFQNTKNAIASSLGVADGAAHDLASSTIAKAQEIQAVHGGTIEEAASGIIQQMGGAELKKRFSATPMKVFRSTQAEDLARELLIDQMQLSGYQADQLKKNVVQQARNLSTKFRAHDLGELTTAIVDVLTEHGDVSLVYNFATSERLKGEIKYRLDNA